MRTRAHGMHVLVTCVLVAAVPVATWGLMGQDNAQGLPPSQLDHAYEPPAIPAGVQTALGVGALLLAAAGLALLVRAWRSGTFDRRWWQVLGPLMVAGLIVGAGFRVLTAGVVGDNIGAGVVVLFGTPVVAALVLWAAARGLWLALRRDDRGPGAGTGVGSTSGAPS